MKTILRKLVLWGLKRLAKRRMKKFRGKIVAVTGSVGKTSTKEAIFTVLNIRFKVKRSRGSMNTDFGLLLSILDIDSGYSSAMKWSWLLMRGFLNSFFRDHSEILLFELGVDKKGDMDFLTGIVRPKVAVFTGVEAVHMADGQFESLEEIFEEKSKIAGALTEGGCLIVNLDNDFSARLAKRGVVTYGRADSDYKISAVKPGLEGAEFKINGKVVRVAALGEFLAYVGAAAIACGELFGIEFKDCVAALQKYRLPPGRMSLIPGREGSVIIDSSYNASPVSMVEALKTLKKVGEGRRRVAVLGNMNELGKRSEELHSVVGELVPDCVDYLITVGKDAKLFGEKMDGHKFFDFDTAKEAIEFFEKKIDGGDVILVKGSQNNVRLERFVKAFMAEPERAGELLVRQGKAWR